MDLKSSSDMFLRGEVGIVMRQSIDAKALINSTAKNFNIGVMSFPTIMKENSSYAANQLVEIGAVPNSTMGIPVTIDEAQLPAAIKFLKFLTSPKVQGMFGKNLLRIPVVDNAELPAALSGFKIEGIPQKLNIFGGALDKTLLEYNHKLGQLFMEGNLSHEKYLEELQKIMVKGVEEKKQTQSWNKDNNYGIK
jgi:hypothetical protein